MKDERLLQDMSWDHLPGVDFIVDLSAGAWRSREVARQLAEAAGFVLPPPGRHYDEDDPEPIGRGVDAEARGPLPVLVAAADAHALAAELPRGATVAVLCGTDQPADENLWTLAFLGRLGLGIARATPPTSPEPTVKALSSQQRALLANFPGPLPPPLAAAAGLENRDELYLPGRPGVIHPRWRPTQPPGPGALAQLVRFETSDPRLRLLCQTLGPAYYADAEWLTQEGMNLFRDGAQHLALRVLERACDVAQDPASRAAAELSLQGLRVFAHEFFAVADHPEPADDLPETVRAQLALLRGWGEIAGPDPAGGLRRITAALQAAETAAPKSATDLFVLNIAALGQLRTGDADAALATELRIARALAEGGAARDGRAEFINALNLARLHQRGREPDAYGRQLDRALATSHGLRSLSDIVQLHLLRAVPGGSTEHPRSHVLRAVLAWLTLSPPEALALRATRLTGARPRTLGEVDQAVCVALAARLQAAWPELQPAPPARFVAVADRVRPGGVALGSPDAAVLLLGPKPTSPDLRPETPERLTLAALATAGLTAEMPLLAQDGAATIGIDTDFGTCIPAGRVGLDRLALRHELDTAYWCGRRLDWDPSERLATGLAAAIVLSPAVARCETTEEGLSVSFQRYRPPERLGGEAARFFAAVGEGGSVAGISHSIGLAPPAGLAIARELEARRLVRLEYAPCMTDGIRSPIRATSASR